MHEIVRALQKCVPMAYLSLCMQTYKSDQQEHHPTTKFKYRIIISVIKLDGALIEMKQPSILKFLSLVRVIS